MNILANVRLDYDKTNDVLTIRKVQARDCQYSQEGRYGIIYKKDITESPCMIEIPEASSVLCIPSDFLIDFSHYDLT